MWNWLASNSAALGAVIAAAPIIWAVVQFILSRGAEARKVRFETYHSLIKQLVERENPDQPMRLDRQIAVVFELCNFKHYYPVTLRILAGLKSDWSSGEYGPAEKRKRLLTEIDLAITHISKKGGKIQTRGSIALWLAFASLLAGTVMVFLVLDRHSHSASDSLRPFVITMLPVWAIALAGAKALLGRQSGR